MRSPTPPPNRHWIL
jgi:signal recognition particle subunit SEC65